MKEKTPKLPDGSVDVKAHLTTDGRKEIVLGTHADGTTTTLLPYVEIDGIQIHPDRVEAYLQRQAEKKEGGAQ